MNKIIGFIIVLLLFPALAFSGESGPQPQTYSFSVSNDTTTVYNPWNIGFSNSRVTDNGNGTVTISELDPLSLHLTGGTMSGNLDMGNFNITNATNITTTNLYASGNSLFNSGTLFVNGSGNNVGIGTTNPGRDLVIAKVGSATFQISDSDYGKTISDGFQIQQIDTDTYLINEEDGNLSLWTNATQKMIVTNAGNVGIGTIPYEDSDSVGILNIARESSKILDIRMDNNLTGDSGAGAFVSLHTMETGGDTALGFGIDDDDTGVSVNAWHLGIDNSNDDIFTIDQGGIGEDSYIAIQRTGQVGLSTSAAKSDLQIKDVVSLFQTGTTTTGTTALGRNIYWDGSNWKRIIADNEIGLWQIGSTGVVGYWQASDAGNTADSIPTLANRFYIDASGDVGIGTISPLSLLDISSSSGTNLTITSTKDGTWTADEVKGQINFYGSDASASGAGNHAWIKALSFNTFGVATDLVFGTTAAGAEATERMRINYLGKVGIGTKTPDVSLDIEEDQNNAELYLTSFKDTASAGTIRLRKAMNTQASPATVANNDIVGSIIGQGYSGNASSFLNLGQIKFEVDGSPDSAGDTTDMPGRIGFGTTPDGSATVSERMRIDNAGNVGIGTTNPTNLLQVGTTSGVGNGSLWVADVCSALSFTDRTPYPENKTQAYNAINSIQKNDAIGGVDHSKLDDFVKSIRVFNIEGNQTIEYGRDLSATVSALVEVIKDIDNRTTALEIRTK